MSIVTHTTCMFSFRKFQPHRSTRKMFSRQSLGHFIRLKRSFHQKHVLCTNALAYSDEAPDSKQKTVIIRHEPKVSEVMMQFTYIHDAINARKSLTCVRKSHERVSHSLDRIKEKILQKIAKKAKKEGVTLTSDDIEIKFDGVDVVDTSTWDDLLDKFSENKSNFVLKINDKPYVIEYNPSSIDKIELQEKVYPGFDCYPSKLHGYGDLSKCEFKWQRKPPGASEWTDCEHGASFIYRVTNDDVGASLRVRCSVQNDEGNVLSESTSNEARIVMPEAAPQTEAIDRRHRHTPHTLPDHQFRVVTYNLLADFYVNTDYSRNTIFPYCDEKILNINFRKALFMHELLGYNCDVMCLQEVDQELYDYDLRHKIEGKNFKGVYSNKGRFPEGLAIYYNTNKFKLVSEDCITLKEAIVNNEMHQDLYTQLKEDERVINRMLSLHNIVRIVVLHSAFNEKYLIVANTHLYSQPGADKLRASQAAVILNEIRFAVDRTITNHQLQKHEVSVVFVGDLNSEPGDKIHELVKTPIFYTESPDQSVDSSNTFTRYLRKALDSLTGKNTEVNNSYQFQSAYDNTQPTVLTKSYTNCLDYIYYSGEKLKLNKTVPLPPVDELVEFTGLPSIKYPSDHLALVADFEWTK